MAGNYRCGDSRDFIRFRVYNKDNMSDEIKYICEDCGKEVGQVIADNKDEKLKWKCQKCFYKNTVSKDQK